MGSMRWLLFQMCGRTLPQSIAEHPNGITPTGFRIGRPDFEVQLWPITVVLNFPDCFLFLHGHVLTYKWSYMPSLKSTREAVYVKTYLSHKTSVNDIQQASGISDWSAGEQSGKDMEILKSSEDVDRWDFLELSKRGKLRAVPSGLTSPSVELWEWGAVKQIGKRQ